MSLPLVILPYAPSRLFKQYLLQFQAVQMTLCSRFRRVGLLFRLPTLQLESIYRKSAQFYSCDHLWHFIYFENLVPPGLFNMGFYTRHYIPWHLDLRLCLGPCIYPTYASVVSCCSLQTASTHLSFWLFDASFFTKTQ